MDYSCGIGPCRPAWLQRFANTKSFLVIYSLLGTVQGMSYIYTTATLTTLEKRFKIPSRTIGILMSGNEVSQVLLSLVMSYHGGRGNRPLWIFWGVAFSALSAYILAVPHVLYGPGKQAIALTEEYLDLSILNSSTPQAKVDLPLLCNANKTTVDDSCEEQSLFSGEFSLMPLILIFMSQFVLGIGTTLNHSLGQTYLDDHTKKTNVPLMLGVVMSLRMVGPAAGFAFSSFCLSLYISPSLTPVIERHDPRWLGAWWLGWLVLGSLKLLFGSLIAFFPKELPPRNPVKLKDGNKNEVEKELMILKEKHSDKLISAAEPLTKSLENNEDDDSLPRKTNNPDDGFFPSLARLLNNKLLIINIFSGVFYIIGSSGSMTFSMKYTEIQYHTSAAGASMISGSATIFAMIFGFLASGYVIGKYRPRPRLILGWNAFLGALHVVGNIIYIFLRCEDNGLYGLDISTGKMNFTNICNNDCGCEGIKYEPVCYPPTDTTFYSACHVGCQTTQSVGNGSTAFGNCSCIPTANEAQNKSLSALLEIMQESELTYSSYIKDSNALIANGPCPVDCTKILLIHVAVSFIIHVLSSSGRVGSIIVNLRCVEQRDKVFAQGLALLVISLFAFIPGPIIFGAIIDAACLVWDNSCGQQGNCWLYHKDKFRLYMQGTAAVITTIGVILDIKVWHLGKNLKLYGEENEEDGKKEKEKQRKENEEKNTIVSK